MFERQSGCRLFGLEAGGRHRNRGRGMAGRGSRLEVAWGSLVDGLIDEAWEVYKRMASLEYGALLVGVESWSGEELGWTGINWV